MCNKAPWIDWEFQYYRAEIAGLEAHIRELEAEVEPVVENLRSEPDYLQDQDNEAFVEDYDDSKFGLQFEEKEDNEDYLGEEYEEYYGEYFPEGKIAKRDVGEFLGGLLESGQKVIEGNPLGGISKFMSTILQPAFHYLINTNDDHTMA